MHISHITAHEVLASGGYPTVEVTVVLDDGSRGRASVPYGASAGSHEAVMLTDGDARRYNGKGVLQAVANVTEKILPAIQAIDPSDQRAIDAAMIAADGTDQKSNIGGNAILAVSLAVAKAVSQSKGMALYEYVHKTFETDTDFSQLPQPMVVAIEGGKHADDTTDMQEYCLSAADLSASPTESIRKILESYHALKKVLKNQGLSTNVGNEGAFAPAGIPTNESPFEYLTQAIAAAGYELGTDIGFSIDPAANEYFSDGTYHLSLEGVSLSTAEMIAYYKQWFEKYPLLTVEDLLAEDDWDGWIQLKKVTDSYSIPLIGDDLTVTDKHRLQKALDLNAISGILIKLNQIGSLTETVETCKLAREHGVMIVPSHRGGGETTDTAMVDVAVAVGASYIKVGPTRGERVGKYNRLMEIEREVWK